MVTHTPPPVIVAVGSKTAECVNTALEINLPEGCQVGDQVKILVETSNAVAKTTEPLTFGQVVTVDRVESA